MVVSNNAQKLLLSIFNETVSTGKDTVERVNLLNFGYSLDQIDTLTAELKTKNLITVDNYVSSPVKLTIAGLTLAKTLKS